MPDGDETGRFSVSDALLPMMDVSILLLGLLLIIVAVAVAQSSSTDQEGAEKSLSLPAEVNLLTVEADGRLVLKGKPLDLAAFRHDLASSNYSAEERLFLITVEDPWSKESDKAYTSVLEILRGRKLRYCLFSN